MNYIVKTDLCYPVFKYFLEKMGFHDNIDSKTKTVGFHHIEKKYEYEDEYQHCTIKHYLKGINSIAHKDELYINIKKYCKELIDQNYIPKSFLINNVNDLKKILYFKKKTMIVKPSTGFGGGDIFVSDDHNYVIDVIKNKYENNKKMGFIISEYINNPLLFNSVKFHFRIYYIPTLVKGKFVSYYSKFGVIYTAEKNYKNNMFNDKKIHDTHLKSTYKFCTFPEHMGDKFPIKSVNRQIKYIMKSIDKISKNKLDLFDDIDNGYYIMGVDMMIDNKFNVKLLEINKHTGFEIFKKNEKDYKLYTIKFFMLIAKHIIHPVYEKNKKYIPININSVDFDRL